MNCQYCGKKLSLIESWRYGKFCSKEHQDEYSDEASHLAASVLAGRQNELTDVEEPLEFLGGDLIPLTDTVVEPPEPPMMEAVAQDEPEPLKWEKPEAPAPPQPVERDWKLFQILANAERAPKVAEKDAKRRLVFEGGPYRFGQVECKGERRVGLPGLGVVQRRPRLKWVDALLPLEALEEQAGLWRPMLGQRDVHWGGETSWNLAEEPEAPSGIESFGDYYEVEEPWADWDWQAIASEAESFRTQAEERERAAQHMREVPPPAPASRPRPPQSPQGHPQAPAAPRASGPRPADGPGGIRLPGLTLSPSSALPFRSERPVAPPPAQVPHGAGPAAIGGPGPAREDRAPSIPTAGLRTRPASQQGASPAERMTPREARQGVDPRAAAPESSQGQTWSRPQQASSHQAWVEISPPLFLALCRLEDVEPADCSRWMKTPGVKPRRWPAALDMDSLGEWLPPGKQVSLGRPELVEESWTAEPIEPEGLRALRRTGCGLEIPDGVLMPIRRGMGLSMRIPARPSNRALVVNVRELAGKRERQMGRRM